MRRLSWLLLLGLAGCASPAKRDAETEARAYERGYQQAVREQYWLIQNQQRQPAETPPKPRKP